MTNLPATPNRNQLDSYLRSGDGLTAVEWMTLPELKSLPILASSEHLLLPVDIEPVEWKAVHNRAFGQYLRTGRLMSMAEGLAEVEWKFNPYHDERGRFTFAPGDVTP